MDNFQSQQEQLVKKEEKKKSDILHCKKCGYTLSSDDIFCPECGEKIGGEERECRWCGAFTTKDICPDCGKRVIPQLCTKCGKETYFDICEYCGQILNPQMQAFAQKESKPVKQMSQAEAQKILNEFAEAEDDEVEHFKKLIKDHEILFAEKKYYDERERRILNTYGVNATAIRYPDPEETKFLQQASEGLRKLALQKEQEALEAAMEKKFPGCKSLEEEQEEYLRLVKEKETSFQKEFTENLTQVEKEIAVIQKRIAEEAEAKRIAEEKRLKEELERKLAEQKRLEEERKRQEELERKIAEQKRREEEMRREKERLRREAFNNRICGTYIHYSHGEEIRLIISVDNNGKLIGKDLVKYEAPNIWEGTEYVAIFSIDGWDGRNFEFEETDCHYIKNPCGLAITALLPKFEGKLNDDGTVIHGHWINSDNSKPLIDYRKY